MRTDTEASGDAAARLKLAKSTVREGFRFLRQLITLRFSDSRVRMLAFGVIGLSGFLPNLATLWLLTQLGVHYVVAAVIANQVAITWNFTLIDRLLFQHRKRRRWSGRFGRFLLLSNADLLIRIPLLAVLVEYAGLNVMLGTVITLVLAFAVRFVVTDRVIYLPVPKKPAPEPVCVDLP